MKLNLPCCVNHSNPMLNINHNLKWEVTTAKIDCYFRILTIENNDTNIFISTFNQHDLTV